MATWSSRRKLAYSGSFLLVLIIILAAIYFSFFYKKPTCFDGLKNGSELDIDCGGSCTKLCQSAFFPPKIAWGGGKYEKVAEGLYNLSSYIINPNPNGAAIDVPYIFTVFDNKGEVITERKGKMAIPPHRNSLAFETAVNVGDRTPAKVTFEFTSAPQWFKSHDTIDDLAIQDKKYDENETDSSLQVTMENKSLVPYGRITVAAVLYDGEKNVIGFSRTLIDEIAAKGGREIAAFTWPFSRQGRVVSIEVLPSTDSVRDR